MDGLELSITPFRLYELGTAGAPIMLDVRPAEDIAPEARR